MARDFFDKACWLLLAVSLTAIVVLATNVGRSGGSPATGLSKALEREMAYRARLDLINKIYGPIEALRLSGKHQEALLKLDELIIKYPGEAHGHILQGQILASMGVSDEAIASYAEGVRLNGDYVDVKNPLSRRPEIQKLVEYGLKDVDQRMSANSENHSLATVLRKVNYLKSRLAGGCE